MKHALIIILILFFGFSCSEITDVFPPLITAEQLNGDLKITVKDDEGIDKVEVKINNSTSNVKVLDTTIYLLGKKDFLFSKKLLRKGNHITDVKAYDINGNWDDKDIKAYVKVGPSLDSTMISQITQTGAKLKSTLIENGDADILSIGFCYSIKSLPTIGESFVTTQTLNQGDFEVSISDLKPNTKYYIRSYASNIIGQSYGPEATFITASIPATIAELSTKSLQNITQNTAISGGEILSDGRSPILSKGICYSKLSNPTITDSITNDGSGTASYFSLLKNLKPNTKYYVRSYATNSIGTAYGNELNFITNPIQVTLPVITTKAATQITKNSIKTGSFITSDGNGLITSKGICFSKTASPTIQDSVILCGSGSVSYDTSIYNLSANSKYYIRAFAINNAGTVYGNEVEAITLVDLVMPQISTSTISNIDYTSATTGGFAINTGGGSVLSKGVCYATTPSPTTANLVVYGGNNSSDFVTNLTALNSGTNYYIRAFIVNELGMSYGNEISFKTNAYAKPNITTSSAINITQTTASVGGNVLSDGGKAITSRGICYSLQSNPTIADSVKYSGNGLGVFSVGLAKLKSNTTYFVRSFATNSIGTSYGNEITITTTPYIDPVVVTNNAIEITRTSAQLIGNITDDGGTAITSRGFYYSTFRPVSTLNGTIVSSGNGSGLFNASITNLQPNTKYYVVAFGVNNNGIIRKLGNEIEFKTDTIAIPTITTNNNVSNITSTTAISGGNISDNGGGVIIESGLCYSVNPFPTIADSIYINTTSNGSFSTSLINLVPNTTYYVRAYAKNSAGIAYGNTISFKTLIVLGDFYQGGIVAYFLTPLDPGFISGEIHGLIIKSNPTSKGWGNTTNTSTAFGTGMSNTTNIVIADGINTAASYCDNLVFNGYSDWYLPSWEELNKISCSCMVVTSNSGTYVWSSSSFDSTRAYCLGCGFNYGYKTAGHRVFPVRSF